MSYEILYDKCFIIADDKYFPMILSGSNNCYECTSNNRERRSRSWFNLTYACPDGKRYATEAELLEHVEHEKQKMLKENGEAAMNDYGWYSAFKIGGNNATTFGQYKGVFVTGMKKALTIEQLKHYYVDVVVSTYDYGTEYQDKAKSIGFEWLGDVTIRDEAHLFETIEKFEKHYKDSGFSWYVGFNEYNLERTMKRIRRELFAKTKKEYVFVDQEYYYTAKFEVRGGDEAYYVKRTKNGIKYSYNPYLQFATEKEAKKLQNRLKGKVAITIEKINERCRVKVLRPIVAEVEVSSV